MWQIIRKQIRPNVDVPFFSMQTDLVSNEFKQHWRDTYVQTDKLIYIHAEPSEDNLSLSITMIWDSRESVDAMLADPIVQENLLTIKNAYLEQNGIVEIVELNQEV